MKRNYRKPVGALLGAVAAWLVTFLYYWFTEAPLDLLSLVVRLLIVVLFAITGWYLAKDYWPEKRK